MVNWLSVLLALLALAPTFQAGTPPPEAALLSTDPPMLEIGQGQIETLKIVLANARNIYGVDLQARFDPTIVQVVDADTGHTGIQMTSGDFLKPDYAVSNTADNQAGTLRYIVSQLNPTPPARGQGVILVIQFWGRTAGTRSKFSITSITIADRRGNKQPVMAQEAELVVVPAKTPTATPLTTLSGTPAKRVRPTSTPTRIKTRTPAFPRATPTWRNPATINAKNAPVADKALKYIAMGGFTGAILLSGLSAWLLAGKRRKRKNIRE